MQKTAYEMCISDWSSDVCSSDLAQHHREQPFRIGARQGERIGVAQRGVGDLHQHLALARRLDVDLEDLQRLSCFESSEERRVGQECVRTCRVLLWRFHEKKIITRLSSNEYKEILIKHTNE